MSRFPRPQQLASWAGKSPGNNESAGKHFNGRTRKGDRWLRGALGEAAAASAGTKNTHLSTRYRRLASRDLVYHDLGADYFDTHVMDPARKVSRLTQQLQALGYRVTLEHAA
jgi:transposase